MEVRRSIDLTVDPDEAWEALTGRAGLEAWMGGPSTLELAPGGLGVLRDHDGSVLLAEVDHIEQGRRLVLRWTPEDPAAGPASRVELVVERRGAHSRVTVIETALATHGETGHDAAAQGWAAARAARWDARLGRLQDRQAATLVRG